MKGERYIKDIKDPGLKAREVAKRTGLWVVLFIFGLTMIYPFLWMLGTAVKTTDPALIQQYGEASSIFPSDRNILTNVFPQTWHWRNFIEVFQAVPFARYFFNSVLVALVVTLGQLVTCSMAAYAFSRLHFRGRDALFFCYLATLMVPGTVTLIPTFILLSRIGAVDTYFALMAPPIFSAYGTFMLRQFFMGIPTELEEAAVIDGCGPVTVFYRIIIPLSTPALATLGIFAFLGNWQSLLTPLVLINRDELKTLPLGLLNFVDMYGANWPLLMAASLLSILPVVFIFLFGQRYFVGGIRLGGVKG